MAAGSADQLEEARERFSVFFDEVMERGIDLERVKTALTLLALREWRKTRAESVAALRAGLDRIGSRGQQTLRQRNLATLLERQGEIVQRGMQSIQRLILPELDMLAKNELRWVEDTWSRYVPKFSLDRYDARTVTRIVRADAFGGNAGPKTIGEWFKGISDETRRAIEARVKAGILRGDAMSTIVDAVRASKGGALTAAGHKIESLVHSAVGAIQNGIRRDVAYENRNSIAYEIWTAALDSSVCVTCASLDGRRWKVGEGPYPLAHIRCRCVRTALVAGFDLAATERASADGPIRGDAKAEDWLRQKPAAYQDKILGKRRAQLFREGKLDGLDPRVLLDSNYRPLPVRDLEAKLRERNLRSNG